MFIQLIMIFFDDVYMWMFLWLWFEELMVYFNVLIGGMYEV